METKEKLLT